MVTSFVLHVKSMKAIAAAAEGVVLPSIAPCHVVWGEAIGPANEVAIVQQGVMR